MIEMTTREFLLLQLVADGVLALLILFLLWQVRRTLGARGTPPGDLEMQALRKVVEDSQAATDRFLAAVEESRSTLKELARALDQREQRIRDLLALSAEAPQPPEPREPEPAAAAEDSRTGPVLSLAAQGLAEQEIARSTGIPDGEVRLILNLAGKR